MSFLPPTSSDLLTGDVEFPEPVNTPVDSQEAPITSNRNVEGALEAFDPNVSMGSLAMEHLSSETHNILLPSPIMSECNNASAESPNSHILADSSEMEADWDNSDLESSDISTESSEMEIDWDDSACYDFSIFLILSKHRSYLDLIASNLNTYPNNHGHISTSLNPQCALLISTPQNSKSTHRDSTVISRTPKDNYINSTHENSI
ncbi:hypothetical protein ARMSODRAFT_955115 [Armillaria solidipes]|uniref:Uncharacterized protein n=1 Tax=Armillaria solidipes TaxID=1076256 RepID=A0A2H3C3C8_9AGAR|nr:hypothetical protein ARMSODRAFT_955115 [Armillaria solidipes]